MVVQDADQDAHSGTGKKMVLDIKQKMIFQQVALYNAVDLLKEKNKHEDITIEHIRKLTNELRMILEEPFKEEKINLLEGEDIK